MGGQGYVVLAHDRQTNSLVAIKVLQRGVVKVSGGGSREGGGGEVGGEEY